MFLRHIDQTVVRRDQNKSRNRALACDMHCDSGANAAPDENYIRMLGVDRVKESERGSKDTFLGRMPCTAAITGIVKQVDRVIREDLGEAGQVERDVFRIPSKVDDGIGARGWPYRHQYRSRTRRERHDGGCAV